MSEKKIGLSIEDFDIKCRLGKGAYGDVFEVVKKSDSKLYAMKQIQKKKLERQQKQYQAMVQKQLLSSIKHPGIIKLSYTFQDKQSLYFILQICEGGQFTKFIKANIDHLSQDIRVYYIAQIVNLLEYIHGCGVTHRDLKPQNLMLDLNGNLKLIDFGTAQITNSNILSQKFKDHILKLKQKSQTVTEKEVTQIEQISGEQQSPLKKRRSTFVGTCYYISPELLEQNYCPASADLWALGCIIYQLYYLQTPFKDSFQFAVFQKIKKAQIIFPKNETITQQAIDLIKRLLVKNPDERLGCGSRQQLSFKELKNHPYFKKFDVDKIYSIPVPFKQQLEQIQQSEYEYKKYNILRDQLKEKQNEIIDNMKNEQKQIIKWEIVEQKIFVKYIPVLLVLFKNNKIIIYNQQKKSSTQLEYKPDSFKELNNKKFYIQTLSGPYIFKSQNPNNWKQPFKTLL